MVSKNIREALNELLISKSDYVENDSADNKVINKYYVRSLAHKYDQELINLLLSNDIVKKEFFSTITTTNNDKITLFKHNEFVFFLMNEEIEGYGYTAYRTKIGLSLKDDDNVKLLRNYGDVVTLSFPFKDCTLVGGQSKDDIEIKERYFHEIIDKDYRSHLLSKKVFTNIKRYTVLKQDSEPIKTNDTKSNTSENKISEKSITSFNTENGLLKDNLLIKGNNLIALHCLKERFAGKIKLIYIDPPYNTGNDSFIYNDNFNHSTWLTFMKNRLEIAKELLSEDGVIFVQCDDNEQAYLKVLMDEIFNRENFTGNIIWEKKYSPANDSKKISDTHDFIITYTTNIAKYKVGMLKRTELMNSRYKNTDNDPRGDWKPGGLSAKTYDAKNDYPIETPKGNIVYPPKGSCWQVTQNRFQELVKDNRIYWGINKDSKPQIKQFLSEVQDGAIPKSIWFRTEVGHNQIGRSEITKLFNDLVFSTPKPEALIQRIIEISTKEGDIVLDYHAGSGTTAAVAHKMGRQWITIEQMDYIEDITCERLKKVLEGEQGGISQAINWQGGGSFVYFELKPHNQIFVDKISAVDIKSEDAKAKFEAIRKEICDKNSGAILYYNIDAEEFKNDANFTHLPVKEQRKILLEALDKNHLYINYSEKDDAMFNNTEFECADNEKEASKNFYYQNLNDK